MILFTLTAAAIVSAAGATPAQKKTVQSFDPEFDAIFTPDARIDAVLQDYFGANEGPVWVRQPRGGYVLFSDLAANRVYKWDPAARQLSVFLERSGYTGNFFFGEVQGLYNGRLVVGLLGSDGAALDAEGRLILCTHGDRSLVRIESDGTRTTLVDRFGGKRLNGPNDLAIRSDGSIYFTDFGGQLRGGFAASPDRELDFRGVFRWRTDGTVQLVSRDIANGIAFSPDEKYAYTTGNKGVRRYEVQADGTLAKPTALIDLPADGIKVDKWGFIFGSSGWVASPQGTILGSINLPDGERATNLTFGDPDGKGIYYTTFRSLYHVRMKRTAW